MALVNDSLCSKTNLPNIRGRMNFLNMLEKRETGSIESYSFKYNAMKLKVNDLVCESREFEIDPLITNCKFLQNSGEDCLIGVWQKDMRPASKHSSIYHLKFEYCDPCKQKGEGDWRDFISDLSCCGPLFKRIDITDFCCNRIEDKNVLIYVGNTAASGGKIILNNTNIDFSNNDNDHEVIYRCKKLIYSCAGNTFCNIFAAGGKNFYYLFNFHQIVKVNLVPCTVIALEFNSNGNVLYCGTEKEPLRFNDLREYNVGSNVHSIDIHSIGPKNVNEIKLLRDERSMVFSTLNGKTFMFDLRMNKEVFKYPEFVSLSKKSLSIEEDLDLICSTNSDDKVRLWSLSTGKLLNCIQHRGRKTKSHACLVSNGRQWFVALGQENAITTYSFLYKFDTVGS